MSWYSLAPHPKHPVSLSVTLLGVTLTCATVWTTLWQQSGGTSLPFYSWETRELHPSPCTWCCRRPRRFSCSSRIRGDPHLGVAQAGGAEALGVLPP